jgi:hypothetical protein
MAQIDPAPPAELVDPVSASPLEPFANPDAAPARAPSPAAVAGPRIPGGNGAMRIFIASLVTETNTFSPLATPLAAFGPDGPAFGRAAYDSARGTRTLTCARSCATRPSA